MLRSDEGFFEQRTHGKRENKDSNLKICYFSGVGEARISNLGFFGRKTRN